MIVTFGELLIRFASPGYSRLFQKELFETSFCGAEANVAVALSNYGLSSEFVSALPDNEIGTAAERELEYFGVGTRFVQRRDGRMGLYYYENGASQRPSRIIYDRDSSVFAQSKNEDYDWNYIFKDASWFHFSGITPALSDELASICLEACKKAKEREITVSCDLNYRAKLWSKEKANSVMKKLIEYVDVCIANEEDASNIFGIQAFDSDIEKGKLSHKGYQGVAKQICDRFGCRISAISLRKSYSASRNGWMIMMYDSISKHSYFSKEYDIQIVDRVGAGDSFAAGIIYGLMNKMDCLNITEFAAAASCLKHTVEGDFNRVTFSEIESLMLSSGNGRIKR